MKKIVLSAFLLRGIKTLFLFEEHLTKPKLKFQQKNVEKLNSFSQKLKNVLIKKKETRGRQSINHCYKLCSLLINHSRLQMKNLSQNKVS